VTPLQKSKRVLPSIKDGKRRQFVGAALMVAGIASLSISLVIQPDFRAAAMWQFDQSNDMQTLGWILIMFGGELLLWGLIDGVRAFRHEAQFRS